jgi:hypothetical protein
MTRVAVWVSGFPRAMPPQASFLPDFWLLVPGALGLIGLAQFAGDARTAAAQELVSTVVSIYAVAVGVLFGSLLLASVGATRTRVRVLAMPLVERNPWLSEVLPQLGDRSDSTLEHGHEYQAARCWRTTDADVMARPWRASPRGMSRHVVAPPANALAFRGA